MKTTVPLLVMSIFLLAQSHTDAAQQHQVRVTSIKALLYYEATGRFSNNILSDPKFTLWNTIIGEGSAESPSNSTLALVEVAGPPGKHTPDERVYFRARYERTRIERNGKLASESVHILGKAAIGSLNDAGHTQVGFWLHDTGCNPVRLSASLSSNFAGKVDAMIPFRCGE